MIDSYEITKQQFYIITAAAVFLAVLLVLLGIVIGKNIDLPKTFPSAEEIAENSQVQGDSVIFPSNIDAVPVAGDSVSTKPHVKDEGRVFYEKISTEPDAVESGEKPAGTTTTETVASEPVSPQQSPASKPAAQASPQPVDTGFAIQVSALKNKTKAYDLQKRLAGKGYPVNVFPKRFSNGAMVYQVRVGPYATREDARKVADDLEKRERLSTWIVATN